MDRLDWSWMDEEDCIDEEETKIIEEFLETALVSENHIKIEQILDKNLTITELRDQIDEMYIECMQHLGLTLEEAESKIEKKYNLNLINDIMIGKIPMSSIYKNTNTIFMAEGESSKRPRQDFGIGFPKIEIDEEMYEGGRPSWKPNTERYNSNNKWKNYGKPQPGGQIY